MAPVSQGAGTPAMGAQCAAGEGERKDARVKQRDAHKTRRRAHRRGSAAAMRRTASSRSAALRA